MASLARSARIRAYLVSEATFSWLCRPMVTTSLNLGLARMPGAIRSMEAWVSLLEFLPMLSIKDLLLGHQKR